VEDTSKKLILLFVFDKMAIPLSRDTVMDLVTQDNKWLTGIECQQLLIELSDTYLLFSKKNNDKVFYSITTDGRECLANFYTRIPSSLRDEITRYTRENRLQYRKKQEYFSDYQKNPDGTYTVILKISDGGNSVMELKLAVPNRRTAQRIYLNWVNKAAQAYGVLYETIID
jgi:hypothetical protein